MIQNIQSVALSWIKASPDQAKQLLSDYYCATRDLFQARLDVMNSLLLKNSNIPEDNAYLLSAIAGEIGSNSFDHNLGNWPDTIGIFFAYDFSHEQNNSIVLADRGQGILKTLQKVRPTLSNDVEALQTAFTKKISGRAPENRGNGLKFVRQNIQARKMHLTFISGEAQAEVNDVMEIQKCSDNMRGCLAMLGKIEK